MASRKGKGGGNSYGSSAYGGTSGVDNVAAGVADISVNTEDGEWETSGRKQKRAPKQFSGTAGVSRPRAQPDSTQKSGYQRQPQLPSYQKQNNWIAKEQASSSASGSQPVSQSSGSGSSWQTAYTVQSTTVPPPLQNGWQWRSRAPSGVSNQNQDARINTSGSRTFGEQSSSFDDPGSEDEVLNDSEEEEVLEDTDDELFSDGEYDSDISQKSHETQKKNKMFRKFFSSFDALTVDQINEPSRQWHCPACQGGPGAIDWYKGLQPLITHAKTKGSVRVKLHRNFAGLLEEEVYRRGTSLIPHGEVYGKWKGLKEHTADRDIVWPPMVIIQNTLHDKGDDDKWIGMGNQELLDYFKGYDAKKARHSYGPRGHRGMSLLIFDSSAMGYQEAERLHKHFADEHKDRDSWDRCRTSFIPGGTRVLYGYMATKPDMEKFNQHCQGKTKLKYDLKSYIEVVVNPMKQMEEDNQQLIWYKNKVAKEEQASKTLKETVSVVAKRLRSKEQENKMVRDMSRKQHDESRKEMDAQEEFYRKQILELHEIVGTLERGLEEGQKELREKALDYHSKLESGQANPSATASVNHSEQDEIRKEELVKMEDIIEDHGKRMEEYELERQKTIQVYDEKRRDFKHKQLQAEVELEKKFKDAMTELVQKYMPSTQ